MMRGRRKRRKNSDQDPSHHTSFSLKESRVRCFSASFVIPVIDTFRAIPTQPGKTDPASPALTAASARCGRRSPRHPDSWNQKRLQEPLLFHFWITWSLSSVVRIQILHLPRPRLETGEVAVSAKFIHGVGRVLEGDDFPG